MYEDSSLSFFCHRVKENQMIGSSYKEVSKYVAIRRQYEESDQGSCGKGFVENGRCPNEATCPYRKGGYDKR
jgi:hypothetical protein